MGNFDGVYAIWVREIIVFMCEKERVISAVVTPLMWIFAVGGGLKSRDGRRVGLAGWRSAPRSGVADDPAAFQSTWDSAGGIARWKAS